MNLEMINSEMEIEKSEVWNPVALLGHRNFEILLLCIGGEISESILNVRGPRCKIIHALCARKILSHDH